MSSTKVYGVPVTSQLTGITKMVRPIQQMQTVQQYRQSLPPQQSMVSIGPAPLTTNQLLYPPPPQYPMPPDDDLTPQMPKPIDEANANETNNENKSTTSSKLSKSQLTASTPNIQTITNTVIRQTTDAKTIISEVKRNLDILISNNNIQDNESKLLLEISKKQLDLLIIILNK